MSKHTPDMTSPKLADWYTAQELSGLPGLPGTVQGVNYRARQEGWSWQPRKAQGGGREFLFSCLPPDTQAALLVRLSGETTQIASQVDSQVCMSSTALNDRQRAVMSARLAFCREIERMMQLVSQKSAIDALVKHAQAGTLSPYLQSRVEVANDRKTEDRGLSERTLKRWLAIWRSADRNEAALAPLRQRANLGMPDWASEFLRCYQRPTKPSVAASYAEFVTKYEGWPRAFTQFKDCSRKYRRTLSTVVA
ncbi:hypothetical protein NWF32_31100 [Pseudomonas qingdaonensis]|nr:hypothetical protein [Pseudomonas qingdaonensis]